MQRTILGIAISLWVAGCATAAEPASPPPSASYRYLFLLDASKGMSAQRETAIDTIYSLLANGINRRAQGGDLVGLWTFNDQLNTNGFPPQFWNARQPVDIANYAYRYLDELKFSGRANLDTAMQGLLEVTRKSDRLIAFLVSSGKESIQGTPFDVRVNAVFDAHGAKMREAQKPFITVFVVRDGEMVTHAISPAGETVYIPPLPEEETTAPPEEIAEDTPTAPTPTPEPVAAETAAPTITTQTVPATNPPPVQTVKSIQQIQKEMLRSEMEMARERAAEEAAAAAAAAEATNNAAALPPPTSNQVTAATTAPPPLAETTPPPAIPPPSTAVAEPTTSDLDAEVIPEPPPTATSTADAAPESPSPEALSPRTPTPAKLPTHQEPVAADGPSSWPHLLRGAGFVFAALALTWILLRNMRQRRGASIITQSLDHQEAGEEARKGDTQVYR